MSALRVDTLGITTTQCDGVSRHLAAILNPTSYLWKKLC